MFIVFVIHVYLAHNVQAYGTHCLDGRYVEVKPCDREGPGQQNQQREAPCYRPFLLLPARDDDRLVLPAPSGQQSFTGEPPSFVATELLRVSEC